MGETVIGPTSTAYPTRVYPVLVQTKPRWSDDWAYEPELTFAGGTANAAGADLDVCTLTRRYGVTKEPHETAFSSKVPQNRTGWWVRIEQHGEQGAQQLWIGQIATETREVHGSESHGPSGVQTWTAYGPQQILRKTDISQAWAQKSPNTYDTTAVLLGWMPPINEDPGTGTPGNATSATFGGISKIFGVDGLWNHKELLEYVLGNFIDTDDGPTWTIGGQDDLLEDLSETIPLGVKVSAAELIRLLIPTKYGLDYKLVSTEAGFEVFVYALNALPYSFGDATLAHGSLYVALWGPRLRSRCKRSGQQPTRRPTKQAPGLPQIRATGTTRRGRPTSGTPCSNISASALMCHPIPPTMSRRTVNWPGYRRANCGDGRPRGGRHSTGRHSERTSTTAEIRR